MHVYFLLTLQVYFRSVGPAYYRIQAGWDVIHLEVTGGAMVSRKILWGETGVVVKHFCLKLTHSVPFTAYYMEVTWSRLEPKEPGHDNLEVSWNRRVRNTCQWKAPMASIVCKSRSITQSCCIILILQTMCPKLGELD
jgi:hypothetical protein